MWSHQFGVIYIYSHSQEFNNTIENYKLNVKERDKQYIKISIKILGWNIHVR